MVMDLLLLEPKVVLIYEFTRLSLIFVFRILHQIDRGGESTEI
jgi:hypothetical protein